MVVDQKDEVLRVIKTRGPVLPVDVRKALGLEILIASAYLSQLVSANLVKVSHVKVGGSPLYYVPGQEVGLEKHKDRLHEKEAKAFDLLKSERILKDNDQPPVVKVALRNIKDFAKPIEVKHKEQVFLFWKWHTVTNEEAQRIITQIISPEQEKPPEQPIEPAPKPQKKPKSVKKPEPKPPPAVPPEQDKLAIDLSGFTDPLIKKMAVYCSTYKIKVYNLKVVRAKTEADAEVGLPSSVGRLRYFCKVKGKQKITHGDLSSVFVQGQIKKLPVLLLTTGKLTKKAKEMLESEFSNMKVRKI